MLKVDNVSFGYSKAPVIKSVSFQVSLGEHVSIVGESGSGKTTLLKLLYGFYDLNQGQISWKKQPILGPKFNLVIGYDYMKYVSQEFDFVPFFTVEETVGKHLSNFYLKRKAQRILELLEIVGLTEFSKTKIKDLSGGQKQRVAIVTAIAKQPEIILLDEPFSHIDNFKKQSLREKFFAFLKAENITCIVATHDKHDVLRYSDKMLVLQHGKLIAANSPEKFYNSPKTTVIASFFSEYNTIPASLFSNGKKGYYLIYSTELKKVNSSALKTTVEKSLYNGKNYLICAKGINFSAKFEHAKKIEKGSIIYLDFPSNLKETRFVESL